MIAERFGHGVMHRTVVLATSKRANADSGGPVCWDRRLVHRDSHRPEVTDKLVATCLEKLYCNCFGAPAACPNANTNIGWIVNQEFANPRLSLIEQIGSNALPVELRVHIAIQIDTPG